MSARVEVQGDLYNDCKINVESTAEDAYESRIEFLEVLFWETLKWVIKI